MKHADVEPEARVAAAAVESWKDEGWEVVDDAEAQQAVETATDLEQHHDEVTGAAPAEEDTPKRSTRSKS